MQECFWPVQACRKTCTTMLGAALTMTAGMMTAAMLGSSALTIWQMLLPAASHHMRACMWTTHRWATQTTPESSLQHASQCEAPFTLSAEIPLCCRRMATKATMVWHKGNTDKKSGRGVKLVCQAWS